MFAARGCASATVDSRGLPVDSVLIVGVPPGLPTLVDFQTAAYQAIDDRPLVAEPYIPGINGGDAPGGRSG